MLSGSDYRYFKEYDALFTFGIGYFFTPFTFTRKTKIFFDTFSLVEFYVDIFEKFFNIELPKPMRDIVGYVLMEKYSKAIRASEYFVYTNKCNRRKYLDIVGAPFFAWNHQNIKLRNLKEKSDPIIITMLNRYNPEKRIEMGIEAIRNIIELNISKKIKSTLLRI